MLGRDVSAVLAAHGEQLALVMTQPDQSVAGGTDAPADMGAAPASAPPQPDFASTYGDQLDAPPADSWDLAGCPP